ncbi:hypothetical protein LTS18_010486 [Coniosporium uncinatum]|uniref:Uncharacterized protein n=1 Tax=Coniosporium uncinatum TaxID=93489 RepID=A0ACC3DL37_9PEZI|nr:hypothetical protein LTS18_010486 [Coniosporium uncinatum]
MPLLNLPSELLLDIFRFVGATFFQDNISCLTICKRWHDLASEILTSEVQLTHCNIFRFPPRCSRINALLHANLTSISIRFVGLGNVPLDQLSGDASQEDLALKLKHHLEALATGLIKYRSLSTLCFQVIDEISDSSYGIPMVEYVQRSPLEALLSAPTHLGLTTLVLDTAGCEKEDGDHLCPLVARKLSTLRTLRVTLRHMCDELLRPDSSMSGLPLRELLLDFVLPVRDKASGKLRSLFPTFPCIKTRFGRRDGLEEQMLAAAKALLERAPRAESVMIRTMRHEYMGFGVDQTSQGFESLKMVTVNCLSGERVEVKPDEGDWEPMDELEGTMGGW